MSDRGPDPDTESPWANDVPVAPPPVEFTWAQSDAESTHHPAAPLSGATGSLLDSPLRSEPLSTAASAPATGDQRSRRTWFAAAAVVAVLALGVAVLLNRSGSADDEAGQPATSVPAATGSSDSLPDLDTSESETNEPETNEPETSDDDEPTSQTGSTGAALWTADLIELPEALASSSTPFTVVMIGADGGYREVQIPSGRVDAYELAPPVSQAQLAVGSTSSLLAAYNRRTSTLLRVGEPAIEFTLPDNRNDMLAVPGTDQYVAILYNGGGNQLEEVRVLADGTVQTGLSEVVGGYGWQVRYGPGGVTYINEAGGVYRVDGSTIERVSTGTMITSSAEHLLVRECDEQLVCGYVVVDPAGGNRVETGLDDAGIGAFGFDAAELSPDGEWLRYLIYNENGVEEKIVNLLSGDSTEIVGVPTSPGSQSSWTPDSSGVVRRLAGGGIGVLDVDSGDLVEFADEFGSIVLFAVRPGGSAGVPPAAGTPMSSGVQLIGLAEVGQVVQIDVDTGAVVATDSPGIGSTAPATILPDAEGAWIVSYDNVPSLRFDAAERTAVEVDVPSPARLVQPGPFANSLWQQQGGVASAGRLVSELVDPFGQPLGATLDLGPTDDVDLIGADGGGGSLVESDLGGVYVIAPDGARQLVTTGEVLAIGPSVAYVRECDGALVCGVVRVDRAGAERRVVDLGALGNIGDVQQAAVPMGQSVSPDGDVLIGRVDGGATSALVVDVANESSIGVQSLDVGSPIVWSADSGYAVWLADGAIWVFDRSTTTVRRLNTIPMQAIAAVPGDVATIPVASP